jgi:hypothetical protein
MGVSSLVDISCFSPLYLLSSSSYIEQAFRLYCRSRLPLPIFRSDSPYPSSSSTTSEHLAFLFPVPLLSFYLSGLSCSPFYFTPPFPFQCKDLFPPFPSLSCLIPSIIPSFLSNTHRPDQRRSTSAPSSPRSKSLQTHLSHLNRLKHSHIRSEPPFPPVPRDPTTPCIPSHTAATSTHLLSLLFRTPYPMDI